MDDDAIIDWVMKRSFTDFRQLLPDDSGVDIYSDGERVGTISNIVDGHCYINHYSGTQEMKPFMEAQYLYVVPVDPDRDDQEET